MDMIQVGIDVEETLPTNQFLAVERTVTFLELCMTFEWYGSSFYIEWHLSPPKDQLRLTLITYNSFYLKFRFPEIQNEAEFQSSSFQIIKCLSQMIGVD